MEHGTQRRINGGINCQATCQIYFINRKEIMIDFLLYRKINFFGVRLNTLLLCYAYLCWFCRDLSITYLLTNDIATRVKKEKN